MKAATGELNMTVIVVLSVGILAAFFFGVLWPTISNNFKANAQCRNSVCDCSKAKENNYMCTCKAKSDSTDTYLCPFGG